MPPILPDIVAEIASCAPLDTRIALSCISKAVNDLMRAGIYRNLSLSCTAAPLLVRTLAENHALPPMVHSLRFARPIRGFSWVNGAEWNQVLEDMINLKHLHVEQYVNMDVRIISRIQFSLLSFTAGFAIAGGWDALVRTQVEMESLIFCGSFSSFAGPPPNGLGRLRHLTAAVPTLALFLEQYPLNSVQFLRPRVAPGLSMPMYALERLATRPASIVKLCLLCAQFAALPLEVVGGSWLQGLQELTLDETEGSWDRRLASLAQVASLLTPARIPTLSLLRLVDFDTVYSEWQDIVAWILHERCHLRTLRRLHICSKEGCTSWSDWGNVGQIVKAQTWTGSYWEAGGLKPLGLRFQLGHGRNQACPNPIADDAFVINDFRGVHAVALDYCGCRGMSHRKQLTCARLLHEGPSEASAYDWGMPSSIQRETMRLFLEMVNSRILDRKHPPICNDEARKDVSSLRADILGGHRQKLSPLTMEDAVAEKKERRRGGAMQIITSSEPVPNEWLRWKGLTDVLAEWAAEEGQSLPLELLEAPAIGYSYVVDTEGSIYMACSHGFFGDRAYMGHQRHVRVKIPDDREDVHFIEGQPMEDAWMVTAATVDNRDGDFDSAHTDTATPRHIQCELRRRAYYWRKKYHARGLLQHTHWQGQIDQVNRRIRKLLIRNDRERELCLRDYYQCQKLSHSTGLSQNSHYQAKINMVNEQIRWLDGKLSTLFRVLVVGNQVGNIVVLVVLTNRGGGTVGGGGARVCV
ncbi:hypothetical protein C8J57DRAFT_1579345 [Mycena rebaudengoi]|nr:hypothetical protein C8J57DRAFT_1579345 [Mycena rebaudengoi]